MNVFFDVDLTIVGSFLDLRPHAKEVFGILKDEGHKVYLWSTGGKTYVEYVVLRCELEAYVDGCMNKNGTADPFPDFCVDDLEEFVAQYGGYRIRPFVGFSEHDTEMLEALERIRTFALSRDGALSSEKG